MANRSSRSRSRASEFVDLSTRSVPRDFVDRFEDASETSHRDRAVYLGEFDGTRSLDIWMPARALRIYPPRVFHRMASTLAVTRFPAKRLFMSAPSRVRFCIRRKERRQVLFALGRAGFGGSARKKHWYRNAASEYRC